MTRVLFKLFDAGNKGALSKQDLVALSLLCLRMAEYTNADEPPAAKGTAATEYMHVAQKLACAALDRTNSDAQVTPDAFIGWLNAQFPLFYSIFASWMANKCFGALARPSYRAPRLSHKSDILSR